MALFHLLQGRQGPVKPRIHRWKPLSTYLIEKQNTKLAFYWFESVTRRQLMQRLAYPENTLFPGLVQSWALLGSCNREGPFPTVAERCVFKRNHNGEARDSVLHEPGASYKNNSLRAEAELS